MIILTKNKKKLGFFKDEVNGRIITEFIGLKPKMYTIKLDDELFKAKGVPTHKVKKHITFDQYYKTLM